jgi:hypothetical protein
MLPTLPKRWYLMLEKVNSSIQLYIYMFYLPEGVVFLVVSSVEMDAFADSAN